MISSILNYFQAWGFMRWFRLALAIFLIGDGVYNMQYFTLIIGGIFLFQAFTNTACCSGGACEIPASRNNKSKEN